MKFISQRLFHDNKQTFGLLQGEGFKAAFTLEDEPRSVKVKGKTRIPAGLYVLKITKEDSQGSADKQKLLDKMTQK